MPLSGPLLLAVLLAAPPRPAEAPFEAARPAMRVYGQADGLPNASLYALTLDAKGRLWAGTMDGAAIYTGGGWRAVTPPYPSGGFIRTLLEGADGAMWFGTQDGGLLRLRDGTWSQYAQAQGLPSSRVNCLLETRNRAGRPVLWAGLGSGGVARLEDGRWTCAGTEMGLPDGTVWKLREIIEPDGLARIWAATPRGLARLAGDRWEPVAEPFPGRHANDILQVRPPDGRTEVWVSGWGLGVARWDGRTWSTFGPAQGFPGLHPTSLASTLDRQGRPVVWVGTYDRGVAWYDGTWHVLDEATGFPSAGVNAVAALPGGKPAVWLGTRTNGVVALDPGGWRTLDQRTGLPGVEAGAFLETPGAFWIGTPAGLVRWEGGKRVVESAATGLPSDYVMQLLATREPDGEELLWATTLKGLMVRRKGTWRLLGPEDGLPRALATSLAETEEEGARTLWVGFDRGLACRRRGTWHASLAEEGFPQSGVQALCAVTDLEGRSSLWSSTRAMGVSRLRGGTWTRFGTERGLPAQSVSAFLPYPGPRAPTALFAATLGGGLACLDLGREDARWRTWTTRTLPGLPSDTLMRLCRDAQGRLYLNTPRGVARLHLDTRGGRLEPVRVETFTPGDGLPTLSTTGGATVDSAGRVWVGTTRGAAVLDLERESFSPLPPPLVFERVGMPGGAAVLPGQVLPHTQGHLRFEFALPTFHRQEDTRYRTQLENLEARPTPWGPGTSREFAALPAGRHVLKVWARDFDGRESGPVAFAFTVKPPPWRSPWAYLAYILGLAGLLHLAYRLRLRLLVERAQRLERVVGERTRALEASLQELERANQSLTGALTEVKTLKGFIPICARCKKIRDDQGYWDQLETYLSRHSDATFSHGICPECAHELYPEFLTRKRPRPSR